MINFKAVGLTVFPIACGSLNGIFFGPNRHNKDDYYNKLLKPPFQPPGWIFGPVWTTLYGMMGYASYRILSLDGKADISTAMTAYGVQFALNMSWTPVFFGWHKMKTGGLICAALSASIAWTIKEFHDLDLVASRLLYPYLAWSCFATVLTWSLVYLNKGNKALKEE
ncbi:protein CrtK-like [Symsagittifera roscoffensis]|uniref:protein CrtK-like n=1 Tax=Symsagittifera roscoffensis TaxID=84072 RepID=UPI00307BD6AC